MAPMGGRTSPPAEGTVSARGSELVPVVGASAGRLGLCDSGHPIDNPSSRCFPQAECAADRVGGLVSGAAAE